jgi:hypothetical protein
MFAASQLQILQSAVRRRQDKHTTRNLICCRLWVCISVSQFTAQFQKRVIRRTFETRTGTLTGTRMLHPTAVMPLIKKDEMFGHVAGTGDDTLTQRLN